MGEPARPAGPIVVPDTVGSRNDTVLRGESRVPRQVGMIAGRRESEALARMAERDAPTVPEAGAAARSSDPAAASEG